MFDSLKKRLSNVIKAFSKSEEAELDAGHGAAPETKAPEPVPRPADMPAAQPEHAIREEPRAAAPERPRAEAPAIKEVEPPEAHAHPAQKPKAEAAERMRPEPAPSGGRTVPPHGRNAVKLSMGTKIKGAIFSKVKLSQSDIDNFSEMLEVSMLESDVAYGTTEELVSKLKERLSGIQLGSKDIQASLVREVRASLFDVISGPRQKGVDIMAVIAARKAAAETPVKILFLGPNGTGKTTTIGKIAYLLKSSGMTAAMSASDTFRAAAIEQTEHHARVLGVPVIKSGYGADPASVAFDAVSYAKAHGIDAVLIDSAGRQETNKNLISELQKMSRVIKPDITVYVGESTSGNVIAEQISEFSKFVRIDGIILTKLDCDAKGGSAISIAEVTGVPILFLGTGEAYTALIPYDPKLIVDAILPEGEGASAE